VLRAAFENRDLTALLNRVPLIFALGTEAHVAEAALQAAGRVGAFIPCRALASIESAWYAETLRRVTLWQSQDAVNTATLKRFGKRWERNLQANVALRSRAPGVGQLAGTEKRPVLLVAGGPSLDDTASFLPSLAQKCIVVAVDTAICFLSRLAITADFIVSVDAQYWNFRHLDRAPVQNTTLIASPEAYPALFRLPWRAIYLTAPPRTEAPHPDRLAAGGSVATTAFDFARRLSPGAPLYIAGLDLSFPHLATHFKGALFEKRALSAANRFAPSETASFHALRAGFPYWARAAGGGRVLTDKRLSLYALWFETALRDTRAPVYSLSSNGLAISGLPLIFFPKTT
jgi:hypothetical protein